MQDEALSPSEGIEPPPSGIRQSDYVSLANRPERPCDACRRRKSRCVINPDSTACVLCDFHHQPCTFFQGTVPRKRKSLDPTDKPDRVKRRRSSPNGSAQPAELIAEDYAKLRGPSLLKTTLGLQNHRHARYIGATAEYEPALLDLRLYDDLNGESPSGIGSFRKASEGDHFWQLPEEPADKTRDIEALDVIENVVTPHGQSLIKLYFRIIHPSFPILHKKVFLEKYGRTHREFSPPLLAAVYILALDYWSYDSDLVQLQKPQVAKLEDLAFRTLQDISSRAKLSTVQAGLLLLQRPQHRHSWMLTAQLVAIGQDLGLHLDCTTWRIPSWEKGLRKRLGWALYMQDVWSALVYGRPPHISVSNWAVHEVIGSDFPERSLDEDEEDGSSEVEKGRILFMAMITLSTLLFNVLDVLYSHKAECDIRMAVDSTRCVLEKAKPIQLKLRMWHTDLPDCLQMDNLTPRKLSSQGYLHLAYFAIEITLHRRIIRSLSSDTDPYITQICRSAAKTRLLGALDFVAHLKPEHLQSFWYFASKVNFALIGSFNSLLWVTAISQDEADFYQHRLQEYRWALRVSSKSAGFLDLASGILEAAVGAVFKIAKSTTAADLSPATDIEGQLASGASLVDPLSPGAEGRASHALLEDSFVNDTRLRRIESNQWAAQYEKTFSKVTGNLEERFQ